MEFKEILERKIKHYGKTEAAYEFAAEEYSNKLIKEAQNEPLTLYSVIHWVAMKDKTPPDTVEEYYTLDDEGNIDVLQWTEGSCFMWCSGGHWNRKEDLDYTKITHWAIIKQPCL